MKKIYSMLFFIISFVIISGCSTEDSNTIEETHLKIYTTVYPLQFIVEEIAQDTVHVETIYPPGVDEHTFEPTSRDLTNMAEADALIYIGAGLEAFAQTAADALHNQPVELIEIGSNEELFLEDNHSDSHDHEHHHSDLDPHIWIDPIRMIDMARIIKDELIQMNPEGESFYEDNFINLEKAMQQLNEEFQELLASKTNKTILVSHAAFGYWESRYNIEQIAIHGLSTENEPSQKELIEIIELAQEYNIQHVIFEQNVTTNVAKIIQNEVGADALAIHNLAVLTEDDLHNERNYLSIMKDNLSVLDEVLN